VEYLQKMQMLLHCVGVSDPKLMDKSSLRCDVNVSVNRFVTTSPGILPRRGSHSPVLTRLGEPRGTRCEVKNVNSLKQIQRAIGTRLRASVIGRRSDEAEELTTVDDPRLRNGKADPVIEGGRDDRTRDSLL
jgi:aspartyl-tRNA(Asn)/glutamyl-tRNA(Gln) amidotransferase subunit B